MELLTVKVDKSEIEKRYKPVFDIFTQHIHNQNKKRNLLKRIADKTTISFNPIDVRGSKNGIPKVVMGAYDLLNGEITIWYKVYKQRGILEHELLHALGNVYIWQGLLPKRIVKHDRLAANAVTGYYKRKDDFGYPTIETATQSDFKRLKWSSFIPEELSEEIIRDISQKVGSYAFKLERELGKENAGLEFIYYLANGVNYKKAEKIVRQKFGEEKQE